MKNTTFLILFLTALFHVNSQTNEYFSHGENYIVQRWYIGDDDWTYVETKNDTIINGETLYKIQSRYGYDSYVGPAKNSLAKSNNGILYYYSLDQVSNTITDTLIYDYTRSDSILNNKIFSIDTIYFDGFPKKRYFLDENCLDNYVLEGLGKYYDCNTETSSNLRCFSMNGMKYYGNFHEENNIVGIVGNCFSANLGLVENIPALSDSLKMKIVDELGRETIERPNTLLFYIYENGVVKKVFINE